MSKLCQACSQREAKIHLTELKNGKKTEMHLCEPCAQEKNMQVAFPSLLSALVKGGETPSESESVPSNCPDCGLAYSDFKAKGRLGCPQCYDAFAPVLIPLLEKVHNASAHRGSRPAERPEPPETVQEPDPVGALLAGVDPAIEPEPGDEAALLRQELADAIDGEDYERAAELRDRIRALGDSPEDSDPEGSDPEDSNPEDSNPEVSDEL
jgi:protein arginine kinase activator